MYERDFLVEYVDVDYSKETEKTPAIPEWLVLNDDLTVSLTDDFTGKASGKLYVDIYVEGYTVPVKATVNVSAAVTAPKLKLSAAKAVFNTLRDEATATVITLQSANKKVPFEDICVYDVIVADVDAMTAKNAKTYAANAKYEVTDYNAETGEITIDVISGETAINGKILLEAYIENSEQTITLPVAVTAYTKAPTFKFAKSSVIINTHYAETSDSVSIKVTPTPADYLLDDDNFTWKITDAKNNEIEDALDVVFEENTVTVSANENTLPGKYKVVFTLEGATKSVTLNVTVKAPVLKLAKTNLTLNKMYDDCAEVAFKATPADYIFTDENISWNIKDAKNNTFEEDPLDIYVEDNCVIVKINENTDYGATYKVNLVPEETGKAVTLTVKTLAETKSAVKVAVTAKGKLITGDIESAVVITPKWTNLTVGTDITENIKVYATDKVKNSKDVTEMFDIKLNADGTYALRVKDYASLNELNPKDKYSVAVEDVMVKGHVIETGKAVNVTMTLTKAKVEQNTKTVNLYLNDKNRIF